MTFWIWFEWQLWAEPYSVLKDDEETLKMNSITRIFWKAMPLKVQGFAMILDLMLEK